MSISDTGLQKTLRAIGRTPGEFRRDTPLLLQAMQDIEAIKKRLDSLAENPMFKKQAK